MSNIENLERQHVDIKEEILHIKKAINLDNLEENAMDIAKHISLLAGKLKVHLDSEDKFLYPSLLNSENISIKTIANSYINEMGNLSGAFIEYKNKFNTRSKIMNNQQEFIKESKDVAVNLEKRIHKEDEELYPLLK
jgi:hemerythrin-like domain-containing protein